MDVIDFRYWWLTDQGLFEPGGGEDLAPRQFERQWKGGRPTDRNLARMAAEYRRHHPDKAVICAFPQAGWAFLCAGGSMPRLPQTIDRKLLEAIPSMQLWPEACATNRWVLRETGRQYLIYCGAGSSPEVDLSGEQGDFLAHDVDLNSGQVSRLSKPIPAGGIIRLPAQPDRSAVFWLARRL